MQQSPDDARHQASSPLATADGEQPDSMIRWLGFLIAIVFALCGLLYILADAQWTPLVLTVGGIGLILLIAQTVMVIKGFLHRS